MVKRDAEKKVRLFAKQFRALAIVGPRQSGKTTLAKTIFPKKPYISLEDPDERSLALQDTRFFLSRFKNGAIIDEAQRAPELFSFLQSIIDKSEKNAQFILTGSNNFLLQQSISQSLAGRIGYIDLLPFTLSEIKQSGTIFKQPEEWILKGCYPEIYDRKRKPEIWYPSYTRTYAERDVRQLKNIGNTNQFTKFLRLCAGRTGQLLNINALSIESGLDMRTVQAWLSILESSYIVYQLRPHSTNYNKRLVKTSKMYFHDTGLACSLLGIKTLKELELSHFRGALFENAVINEIQKQNINSIKSSELFFWRDNKGIEIDLLLQTGAKQLPVEIKASHTFNTEFLKNINYWNGLSGNKTGKVIYGGVKSFELPGKMTVQSWKEVTV
ncbi:MAG: ATP-binding protein [Chitinophagaceae bacterium]|jgi:uncharacterized protein|nr:ATP-binding protein [Chitinophagaceae bacterium]